MLLMTTPVCCILSPPSPGLALWQPLWALFFRRGHGWGRAWGLFTAVGWLFPQKGSSSRNKGASFSEHPKVPINNGCEERSPNDATLIMQVKKLAQIFFLILVYCLQTKAPDLLRELLRGLHSGNWKELSPLFWPPTHRSHVTSWRQHAAVMSRPTDETPCTAGFSTATGVFHKMFLSPLPPKEQVRGKVFSYFIFPMNFKLKWLK